MFEAQSHGVSASPEHQLTFYESDEVLADAVAAYAGAGLAEGTAVLIIATEPHRLVFAARLEARGFDIVSARAEGRLVLLDAQDTLSRFMIDSLPDWNLFREITASVLDRIATQGSSSGLRAYGEMVDVLWRQGNAAAAVRLEEMWNALQRERSFTLLCAYGMESFYEEPRGVQLVCGAHSHVLAQSDDTSYLPEGAHVRALMDEIAERKNVERSLRESVTALAHSQVALRRSDEELRDFVENATVPLHWVGPDGRILWANRAELDLLGYEKDEYIGRPIADFHVDQTNVKDILAKLGRSEELADHSARLRAKDGSIKHVLINSSVYRRDGTFVHTRCVTRDITEAKRAEETREARLRRTERLNDVTTAIADAVTTEEVFEAVVDQVGRALGAETSALWLTRAKAARLVRAAGYPENARRAIESMPLDSAGAFPATDAIRDGTPIWIASQDELVRRYPHLASLVSKDRYSRVACLPIVTQGRIVGALGLTFDGTRVTDDDEKALLTLVARFAGQALERVRLLERERHHRARTETLYALAAAVNAARTAEEAFEAALDTIGRALGTERTSILVFDSEGVMRFRASRGLSVEYQRAVDGHSPWSRETRDARPIVSNDVEADPAMASYLPLFRSEGIGAIGFIPLVAEGRLVGKFMVYFDRPHEFGRQELDLAGAIADHVAVAISRFAAAAELQRTVKFNEMFTGILAHDLRNPLAGMIMAGRLATSWNKDEKLTNPLARIARSGERMTRMIDQLLDFTRIRLQNGIPIEPGPSDLLTIARHAMDELEDANPDWDLRLKTIGDTKGAWDPDRLSQVFSNLMANAIQHGAQRDGVDVTIDGEDSARVTVTVHNRGLIPPQRIAELFEPLVGSVRRLDKSSGLGLGLYITKEIIKAHGGSVDVLSDVIAGTTFTVLLPRPNR
jgi:PAS domain S-box-containing protein